MKIIKNVIVIEKVSYVDTDRIFYKNINIFFLLTKFPSKMHRLRGILFVNMAIQFSVS